MNHKSLCSSVVRGSDRSPEGKLKFTIPLFRVVFNCLFKVIQVCFDFELLRSAIGSCLCHILNQSEVNLKPILTYLHAFSQFHVFALGSDWSIEVFAFVVIGQCNSFNWFQFCDNQKPPCYQVRSDSLLKGWMPHTYFGWFGCQEITEVKAGIKIQSNARVINSAFLQQVLTEKTFQSVLSAF